MLRYFLNIYKRSSLRFESTISHVEMAMSWVQLEIVTSWLARVTSKLILEVQAKISV